MDNMYQRDSNEAFENAKAKGLKRPQDYMYMYSKDNKDYFKNIDFRDYISFEISFKGNNPNYIENERIEKHWANGTIDHVYKDYK